MDNISKLLSSKRILLCVLLLLSLLSYFFSKKSISILLVSSLLLLDNISNDMNDKEKEKEMFMLKEIKLSNNFSHHEGLGYCIGEYGKCSFITDDYNNNNNINNNNNNINNNSTDGDGNGDGDGKNFKMHMILSHCKNKLDWLDSFLDINMFDSVTIVSKCGVDPTPLPILKAKHLQLLFMDNVGRCDHTYAWWNARNRDVLGDNDIVLYIKDNQMIHQKGLAKSFEEMVQITKNNGFACFQTPNDGRLVFYWYEHLKHFEHLKYLDNYGGKKMALNKVVNATTLGEYSDYLRLNFSHSYVPVCYGGIFSAKGSQIKNNNRQDLWNDIEKSLSYAENVVEGHYMERLWAAVLTNLLQTTSVQDYLRKYSWVDDTLPYKLGSLRFTDGNLRSTLTLTL